MKSNIYLKIGDLYVLRILSNKFGAVDYIIDEEDIENISKYTWAVAKRHHGIYAQVNTKNKPDGILLHRYIAKPKNGLCVDHINRNTLDNRETNLRVCTYSSNNNNLSRQESAYNIRYIHKTNRLNKPYYVEIKKIFRKRYSNLIDAITERNNYIQEYLPELWHFHQDELMEDLINTLNEEVGNDE